MVDILSQDEIYSMLETKEVSGNVESPFIKLTLNECKDILRVLRTARKELYINESKKDIFFEENEID